mmetsp:Transcript_13813/g.34508  ORF Transcript_13813/g.34508 Transcript_13813/m.34508 type:complete len:88 (+) Transcript_13813:2357-2620(+)
MLTVKSTSKTRMLNLTASIAHYAALHNEFVPQAAMSSGWCTRRLRKPTRGLRDYLSYGERTLRHKCSSEKLSSTSLNTSFSLTLYLN